MRSDSIKPNARVMPYQKKQVMDKNGYVHQPTYRNNNDLEAYDYDENEDLSGLMQNLNDKKSKQSALMKRLEIYKYENSDLNKDLTSTQFK